MACSVIKKKKKEKEKKEINKFIQIKSRNSKERGSIQIKGSKSYII